MLLSSLHQKIAPSSVCKGLWPSNVEATQTRWTPGVVVVVLVLVLVVVVVVVVV